MTQVAQRDRGQPRSLPPVGEQSLIERTWPAIVELANLLDRRGEIGEGDVLRALRVPPGEAGTLYLAELRSGYRAVS